MFWLANSRAVHKILLFESNTASGINELENSLYPDKSLCADLSRKFKIQVFMKKWIIKLCMQYLFSE